MSGSHAHAALYRAGTRIGVAPRIPSGGSEDQLILEFEWHGQNVTWYSDGNVHLINLPTSTALVVCLGDCEPPFVEELGKFEGISAHGLGLPQRPGATDATVWLRADDGSRWLQLLNLDDGEKLECTGSWIEARFKPRDPATDAERVFQLLGQVGRLPAPANVDLSSSSDSPSQLPISADLIAALTDFADLVEPDDVIRMRRLHAADRARLAEFSARGRPLLGEINQLLHDHDSRPDLTPEAQFQISALHAMGQGLDEVEHELRGPD